MEMNDTDIRTDSEKFKKLAHKKHEILSWMDAVEVFDSMYYLVKQWDDIEEEYKSEK